MNQGRKGKIAITFLKEAEHRRGQRALDEMREQIPAVAKKIGTSAEEVAKFVEIFSQELIVEWHERQRLYRLNQPLDSR